MEERGALSRNPRGVSAILQCLVPSSGSCLTSFSGMVFRIAVGWNTYAKLSLGRLSSFGVSFFGVPWIAGSHL